MFKKSEPTLQYTPAEDVKAEKWIALILKVWGLRLESMSSFPRAGASVSISFKAEIYFVRQQGGNMQRQEKQTHAAWGICRAEVER